MSKGICGLHGLSTKKSTMTKVNVRQHVNFMSNLIQLKLWPIRHGLLHMAAHSMRSHDSDTWVCLISSCQRCYTTRVEVVGGNTLKQSVQVKVAVCIDNPISKPAKLLDEFMQLIFLHQACLLSMSCWLIKIYGAKCKQSPTHVL